VTPRREARKIPLAVRREVLASGVCAYCGDYATTVDHIVPVAKGGTADRENLAPACSWCNSDKLDFTPEEWREWRESEGKPWPPESRTALFVRLLAEIQAQEATG
jgi:5-methylcytosine-specific restriction endonuclease McrA